jgi:alpha-1,6-mannosyltransferase
MLWYVYSALPRALAASYALVPLGAWSERRRALPLFLCAGVFVCAYSLLPHKELRFIIYALPVFNLAAAIGCQQL